MKRVLSLIFLATMALTAGCDEHAPPGSTNASPSAAPALLKDEDLATPTDFDDEAEKTITPANYKAEADSLEKEIAAEP